MLDAAMKPLASRVANFAPSPFAAMTALALEHGAVNLGQGFPDFAPPDFVLEAAKEAFAGNLHQYAPPRGHARLQRAVSETLAASLGFIPDPESEITITVGATQAMYSSIQALLEPGDETIILEPTYDMYAPQVALSGGIAKYLPLEPENNFALNLEQLRALCSSQTKILILNTPNNPTGKVFNRSELEGIAALALEFDFYVLSDEAYDRLVYGVNHVCIASLPGMRERTVTIGSAGKMFSVTGWRIGWAISSASLAAAIRRGAQWVPFAAATPVQEAIAIALEQAKTNNYFSSFQAEMLKRRDLLAQILGDAGLEFWQPQGGYFINADTSRFSSDTNDLAKRFVQKIGVAAMPMQMFYSSDHANIAPKALRFAFCKTRETLEAAGERLTKEALQKLL
jgi:aspartate/methionine/tyrosine aminotransferase